MTELEFPWEIEIDAKPTVSKRIYNTSNWANSLDSVTFIYKNKLFKNKKLLFLMGSGVYKIVKIEITKGAFLPSIVVETSAIPYINNLSSVMNIFGSSQLATIPEDLFKYNPQITIFNSCFHNCKLITSIPKNLFKYNTNGLVFMNCFNGTNINTIPKNLFYNTKGEIFNGCFANCSNLKKLEYSIFPKDFILNYQVIERIFPNLNISLSNEVALSLL